MDVKDIQSEIEHVDRAVEKNTDQKLVLGLIARGIWQVAYQLAVTNFRLMELGSDIRRS